jgi:hypothetical protein
VIGWAWSVFNDYDFDANPLGFRHRTVRAIAGASRRIRHLGLADSIGIDYHKTGFAPYISSAVLVRDARLPAPRPQRGGHALRVPVGRAPSRQVHARDDAPGQRDPQPLSEDAHVSAALESIWQARRAIAAEPPPH